MNWSAALPAELKARASDYALAAGVPTYVSREGTVFFEVLDSGTRHGSFTDESYWAILASSEWSMRLKKVHPQRELLPEHRRDSAREVDSSNSSDALLMNNFCHPGFASQLGVVRLIGQPTTPTWCANGGTWSERFVM